MNRRSLALAALLAIAARPARGEDPAAPAPPPAAPPAGAFVASDVRQDTTWSGVVRLESRVRVLAGATLRIAPGTTIVVPWESPAPRPGLEVEGTLLAEGEASAPIRFQPSPPPLAQRPRRDPRWLGLVIHRGSGQPVRLVHCLFRLADAGVQAGRAETEVRDCVFFRCGTGVGVGAIWDGRERLVGFTGDVAPSVDGCRFGDCEVGVTVEVAGRPYVRRCVFDRCANGVANQRPGLVYPVDGLGPYVDRCEFLACSTAVQGPSRVSNSVFERNGLVFAGSTFGDAHVTIVDRFVRAHNLYADNRALARVDVPLGDGALFLAPVRRRPFPEPFTEDELLGPIETGLELRPSSPGIGVATDGGDVGAFGAAPGTRRASSTAVPDAGPRVPRFLDLGPAVPTSLDAVAALAKAFAAKPRLAGDVDGDGGWAALDAATLDDPETSRRLAAQRPGSRVLAATFQAEAGTAGLHLAWDGVLAAWWNGEALALPAGPRRFRADDAVPSVPLRAGVNVLLLRHVPRTTTGRLAVHLTDAANATQPPRAQPLPLVRVEPPKKPPTVTAAASTERGTDGKPTGRGVLRVVFSVPVHWIELRDARALALAPARGPAVDLAAAAFAYRPAERAVVLTFPRPLAAGAWTLTATGLRHASGDPLADAPLVATFRVP